MRDAGPMLKVFQSPKSLRVFGAMEEEGKRGTICTGFRALRSTSVQVLERVGMKGRQRSQRNGQSEDLIQQSLGNVRDLCKRRKPG